MKESSKAKSKKLNKNSKIWEVLTEAKKHLRSTVLGWDEEDKRGSCQYICNAVSVALYGETHIFDHKTHDYIKKQLEGCSDLEVWLEKKGGITRNQIWNDKRGRKQQATRKAWIDHMIKTCKAQNI